VTVLQALRFVFWGALIVVVCVQLGNGFDLFNNVLGYAIIAMGVIGLAKTPVGDRHRLLASLITIVAVLNALWAPFVEGPGRMPSLETGVGTTLDIIDPFAILGFCIVMWRFCGTVALPRSSRSWRTSARCWMVGAPASVTGTCLSCWAVRDERGVISQALTPNLIWLSLGGLFLIKLIVLAHTFFSCGRTIASLKGMVRELPAADDFGLEARPTFQFSIRALLIVAAAVAVVAAGVSQCTIPFWRYTMAGLVGLCLLAMWQDHGMLSKCMLAAVGSVLLLGFVQVGSSGLESGSLCGTSVGVLHVYKEEKLLPESTLTDIDAWLASKGFQRSEPPAVPLASPSGSHSPEPEVTIWYAGEGHNLEGINVRIQYSKNGPNLQFLDMDYASLCVGFLGTVREHQRQVKRFRKEIIAWWQEYYDRFQTGDSKP
jgi:hypothetical protein